MQRLESLAENLPGYVLDENENNTHGVVFEPLTAALLVSGASVKATTRRLCRELRELATHEGELQYPSSKRVRNGTLAYAGYIGLVAINFQLLGLI